MSEFTWPHGEEVAVSLRFDDGTEPHRTIVAPLLSSYGLSGTFYISPKGSEEEWRQHARLWHGVLDAGHEIGNHSFSHPAPAALSGELDGNTYESMTLEQYAADVLEAHRRLELAFGSRSWTYCYPCYGTDVGIGAARQSVIPFISRHFSAACIGSEVTRPYNVPGICDLHALMSVHAEFLSGAELIGHVERARENRRWAIFTFHGIGDGHIPVAREEFEVLLGYLSDRRTEAWTVPVCAVAEHIRSRRR